LTNNDILRRLRYALDLSDAAVLDLYRSIGQELTREDLGRIYARDDDPEFEECPNSLVRDFLDGLILKNRGPRRGSETGNSGDGSGTKDRSKRSTLSNNDILKALRIALNLTSDDIIAIMASAGTKVSASELGALFRTPGHTKFRYCGDQFLRNFLVGLTAKYRS